MTVEELAEAQRRHVEGGKEITHIGMLQTYGLTDEIGQPYKSVMAFSWSDEQQALSQMSELVRWAHGADVAYEKTAVQHPRFDDSDEHVSGNPHMVDVWVFRTPGGPTWGMVSEV